MELANVDFGQTRSGNDQMKLFSRQSSSTDAFASSDFIDYTMFGPMVDEALVGRFCSREYFDLVINACNTILGYSAVSQNRKPSYTASQVAADLVSTNNATCKRDSFKFILRLRYGKVMFVCLASLQGNDNVCTRRHG